jgi:hypothetical protein
MSHKNKYKNLGRSNLTFLNANGNMSYSEWYKIAYAQHQSNLNKLKADADLLLKPLEYKFDTDSMNAKNGIYADLEKKMVAEKQRFEAENQAKKSENIDSIFGKITSSLGAVQSTLGGLGINAPQKSNEAPFSARDTYQQEDKKDYTLWIVGGVAVLGVVGFLLLKKK